MYTETFAQFKKRLGQLDKTRVRSTITLLDGVTAKISKTPQYESSASRAGRRVDHGRGLHRAHRAELLLPRRDSKDMELGGRPYAAATSTRGVGVIGSPGIVDVVVGLGLLAQPAVNQSVFCCTRLSTRSPSDVR